MATPTPVQQLITALQGGNFEQEQAADLAQAAAINISASPPPPGFPTGIPYDTQNHRFRNWSGQINISPIYIFKPVSLAQFVTLANYAAKNKCKLRPVGQMHNWSPIVVDPGTGANPANIYFVSTANLNNKSFQLDATIPTATFGTGVTIEDALAFLEQQTGFGSPQGYSFVNFTGPGHISIGGALAIGAHGTSVPSPVNPSADFCGCLSNLVRSFTALVTVPGGDGTYQLKTFSRGDTDAAAFLVHLGRAFITEVTLQVVPNYYVELTSSYPSVNTVFEAPAPIQSGQALQTFVEQYGRVELIYFPFTEAAWIKTWKQVAGPTQNVQTNPYPLKFANRISLQASNIIQNLFNNAKALTPLLMHVFLDISRTSLHGREGYVMSGLSKNLLLYVEDTTLRITALGYTIQIKRADIQKTANTFYNHFTQQIQLFKNTWGYYPINGPVEIRFTGLDNPSPLGIAGAEAPLLSASSPLNPANPDPTLDTVFWVDILTMPNTPHAAQFFEAMETWMYETWGTALRPEWSKGWGYSTSGNGWDSPTVLNTRIPKFYANTLGRAKATLDKYDQSRIYSDTLLDKIMP